MRILYHHRTQAEDGQAVHIRSLIDAFVEEGHEVREESLVKRASEPHESNGADGGGSRWAWIGRVPRFARELAEYAYTVPARRRLLTAAREFEPDFLYERYAFGNAGGVQAAERLGLPIVIEVNSPMVLELSRTRGLSFPRTAKRVETSVFKRATRVCVVTRVLGDMLVEMGVDEGSIVVTPNGVRPELYESPDRDAAARDLGLAPGGGPVLGFVGYYRDWHRLDLVVAGLAEGSLSDARLVLIGEGPAEGDLRALAARLGVGDRVHFAGPRRHDDIPALLAAFDVALVPAINPYASPLKLFEYMAAGLATVAPDQPNLREILVDGEDAVLVPPGDGEALVAAVARLSGDGELRDRLGSAARRKVRERNLTWRGNARRIVGEVEALA